MDIIADKYVVTRKPHRCWGCMRIFPVKTNMRYSVSVDGGIITGCYWCKDCDDFGKTLDYDETQDGFAMGEFLNYPEYRDKVKAACI